MFQLDWQAIVVAIIVVWAAVYASKNFWLSKLRPQVAQSPQPACGSGGCGSCGGCGATNYPKVEASNQKIEANSRKVETLPITLRNG